MKKFQFYSSDKTVFLSAPHLRPVGREGLPADVADELCLLLVLALPVDAEEAPVEEHLGALGTFITVGVAGVLLRK